jgi:hypothetical protein
MPHEVPAGFVAPSNSLMPSPSCPFRREPTVYIYCGPKCDLAPILCCPPVSAIGSIVPQDHAPASVLRQQAPAAFQTTWYVPALAAPAAASNPVPNSSSFQPTPAQQPVANFTAHRPALIYSPNTNGFPGFETFGAAPEQLLMSTGGLES